MKANTAIRESVAALVGTLQPGLVTVFDTYPTGIDSDSELPAAAVWFDDGQTDPEFIDMAKPMSAPLTVGIYVRASQTDSVLDELADPIWRGLDEVAVLPDVSLSYSGFGYDRDPESTWRVLRLLFTCNYNLEIV
jgi:hypothetical protein